MKRTARVIRDVAFGLIAAFALLGSLFVAGYAFDDPGGLAAVGWVAAWVVPMALLTWVAWRWPQVGLWLLLGGLGLLTAMCVWRAADVDWWREMQDQVGPVLGLSAFTLGLPMATLGLRRPFTAGLMLMGLALIPYVTFLIGIPEDEARSLGNTLTTSGTVSAGPAFTIGLLFLVAAALGRLGKEEPASPAPIDHSPQEPVSV